MIEMGKQYRTRDGRDARVLCVDAQTGGGTVVALVNVYKPSEDIWEEIHCFDFDGFCLDGNKKFELVEVQPVVEWWEEVLPVNPSPCCSFASSSLISREHVDKFCTHVVHFIYDPNTGDLKVEVEKVES